MNAACSKPFERPWRWRPNARDKIGLLKVDEHWFPLIEQPVWRSEWVEPLFLRSSVVVSRGDSREVHACPWGSSASDDPAYDRTDPGSQRHHKGTPERYTNRWPENVRASSPSADHAKQSQKYQRPRRHQWKQPLRWRHEYETKGRRTSNCEGRSRRHRGLHRARGTDLRNAEPIPSVCAQRFLGHELLRNLMSKTGLDAARDIDLSQFLLFEIRVVSRCSRARSAPSVSD